MTKDQAIAELDKRGPSNWKDDHAAMWVLEVLERAGAFESRLRRRLTIIVRWLLICLAAGAIAYAVGTRPDPSIDPYGERTGGRGGGR